MYPVRDVVTIKPAGKKYTLALFKNPKVELIFFQKNNEKFFVLKNKTHDYLEDFGKIMTGNFTATEINEERTKKFIKAYLNEIIHPPPDHEYCNYLLQLLKKPPPAQTGSSVKMGPIALFEKLTLLISAVKSGHDNLENDIKKTCKKLKTMGLISNKIYDKYKEKYFSK